MIRSAARKVMWVGRATVFLVGLAVILALLFGAASMALAKNGNPWILGKFNAATAVTSLGGKQGVNGPMVRIANNNAGANDTALALKVQAGEAPMRVNSRRKVARLNADRIDNREAGSFANGVGGVATNADKLDGKDSASFLSPERIYTVERVHSPGPNTILGGGASCDQEDQAISGGFRNVASTTQVLTSAADTASGFEDIWRVNVRTGSTADPFTALAVCMDLPPLRP